MNALVNDQMSRLRRVLSLNGSPDWQRQHLDGNLVHFGMYTSLTPPTRGPEQSAKPQEFEEYKRHLEEEWESLNGELNSTGNWLAAEGPEMLCRWDMHWAISPIWKNCPKSACRPPANLPSTRIRARIIAPVTPSPPSAVLAPSIRVHRWIRA